ncbi:MAG: hypothetical protein JWL98_314 [Xanthomonadaceae bacterium]|nr:hypothetical protein [Xanthomonadaceae bacterium]
MARVRAATKPTERKRWLLVYNCQVMGLGNCLNLLSDEIEVESYDPAAFKKQSEQLLDRSDEFDLVLVSPKLETNLEIDRTRFRQFWSVPTIFFDAYHPDLCHLVTADGQPLKGATGDYHSLIAYAAFRCGFSARETVLLYRDEVYGALGYYAFWDGARDALLRQFRDCGLSMDARFANWTRNGPFMYSNNHPRIHCIRDVACALLDRAGFEANYREALPHDNLANAPIFPVYPEIASTLGVTGSYLFKRAGYSGFMRLDDFVTSSYALYRELDVSIHPLHKALFDRTLPIVSEML